MSPATRVWVAHCPDCGYLDDWWDNTNHRDDALTWHSIEAHA